MLFVAAGFAEVLPPDVRAAASRVANGIRTSVAVNDEHPEVEAIVKDARVHGSAIVVVGGWDWRRRKLDGSAGELYQDRDANLEPMREHLVSQCRSVVAAWRAVGGIPANLWIEFGNEIDGSYWKRHLDAYHATAIACYKAVRRESLEVKFITGSTMNLDTGLLWKRSGYEVLRELCSYEWPLDTVQGVHPYRAGCSPDSWPSWDSTAEAHSALRDIVGPRRVAITEMGWPSGFGVDDYAIARYVEQEYEAWMRYGAALYCHYQIQDGTDGSEFRDPENHFGAYYRRGGELVAKPVADSLRRMAGNGD